MPHWTKHQLWIGFSIMNRSKNPLTKICSRNRIMSFQSTDYRRSFNSSVALETCPCGIVREISLVKFQF